MRPGQGVATTESKCDCRIDTQSGIGRNGTVEKGLGNGQAGSHNRLSCPVYSHSGPAAPPRRARSDREIFE
jgi:hypothetical protein